VTGAPVTRALIVGGGIAGMAAAIMLRRIGVDVDLIDLDPQWRVYGAGITITGPTLRAFDQIGILDQVCKLGFCGDGLEIRSTNGSVLSRIATPVKGDHAIPGTGGIMRPTLHRILSDRVKQSGARIRLGLTVQTLKQSENIVAVDFTDGSQGNYELIVGADGLFSRVRALVFPDAPKPEYTGQACWRLRLRRDPAINSRCFFLGGPVKVGLTPVSTQEMYMFLLERALPGRRPQAETQYLELKVLLNGYGGILSQVREELSPQSAIVYRPLEAFLLPAPWFKGRVILIGDAAHPTTPQLASGAGLAVEDGIVLAEELSKDVASVASVLTNWMNRRWHRCRMVVENSLEIGRRERAGMPVESQTELLEQSLRKLAEPI
jgi:2-polyprenyl-6-methoxyphenol hydroxylase-like FAD-dependent oxidoreductase